MASLFTRSQSMPASSSMPWLILTALPCALRVSKVDKLLPRQASEERPSRRMSTIWVLGMLIRWVSTPSIWKTPQLLRQMLW